MGELKLGINLWSQASDWESFLRAGRRAEALGYLQRVLREALDRLDPPLGKTVLVRSFGLEGSAATLNELARELDRTRDQVFRLKRNALRQMRALVDHDLLDAIPEPCPAS